MGSEICIRDREVAPGDVSNWPILLGSIYSMQKWSELKTYAERALKAKEDVSLHNMYMAIAVMQTEGKNSTYETYYSRALQLDKMGK